MDDPLHQREPQARCGVASRKQNEAQSARAESTPKGVNQRSKYVTQTQQQRPLSPTVTLTWHACIGMYPAGKVAPAFSPPSCTVPERGCKRKPYLRYKNTLILILSGQG